MKATRLYAQVLIDVAGSAGSATALAGLIQELRAFAETLDSHAQLLRVFESPAFSDEEKSKVLEDLALRAGLGPLAKRFVSILLRRGRLSILGSIATQAETLDVERRGGMVGEITSALPLEGAMLSSIKDALSKKLGKPVHLKEKTDSKLIAGMRVTLGGVTYDGSVRGKLDQLSNSI